MLHAFILITALLLSRAQQPKRTEMLVHMLNYQFTGNSPPKYLYSNTHPLSQPQCQLACVGLQNKIKKYDSDVIEINSYHKTCACAYLIGQDVL
ncbi:hypothetical protein CIPAW_04G189700 [Carya illinoinensis]|uniref:Uncharacterized protein n=1 Tax=Carya illinoinensis TaxID=32201 RepID=A0A8T1QWC4_CARIL|nr:hypothetical protein CIPAW_04G189700 [Carya illinoinensis]